MTSLTYGKLELLICLHFPIEYTRRAYHFDVLAALSSSKEKTKNKTINIVQRQPTAMLMYSGCKLTYT